MRTDETCCKVADLERLLSPKFFKAMCDPNRIAILCHLAQCCIPLTVSQIAENLPVDVSVVSRHLSMLRDSEILIARKQGKKVYYYINTRQLIQILRSIADAFETCCPKEYPATDAQVPIRNSSHNEKESGGGSDR